MTTLLPNMTMTEGGSRFAVAPASHFDIDIRQFESAHVTKSSLIEAMARFDWRAEIPELVGPHGTYRELRREDATSLKERLSTKEVARFTFAPPSSIEGFERFIVWAQEQRAAGQFACFAMIPRGEERAVGLIQVRMSEYQPGTAEWGFALGSRYWGTGLFVEGAKHVVDFTFDEMNVERLEARSLVANGRANGALRKVGAVREGVLRRSFVRSEQRFDEGLWAIVRAATRQIVH
jgi:ribosomal-protein-alanine N-acetyltransferase